MFKVREEMSEVSKFIHVDDEGNVEFCLADADKECPYGSFSNIQEALENYHSRPKRRALIEWPRGFKTIPYSTSWNWKDNVFRHTQLHEEVERYIYSFSYRQVAASNSDMTRKFEFFNDRNGETVSVYANRYGYGINQIFPTLKEAKEAIAKTKNKEDFLKNIEIVVLAYQDALVLGSESGYLLMEQAYIKALKNFKEKYDTNWNSIFMNESVSLKVALQHADKRLDDARISENATNLKLKDATVESYLNLCAEILHRTDVLSEQTVKIFGSNDDYVVVDLLREAIHG